MSECEYCGGDEEEWGCECWRCEDCDVKQEHEPHEDGCPKEGTYYGSTRFYVNETVRKEVPDEEVKE